MTFGNHGNRSFTATSIDRNAPAASGVYGLADSRQWIYVGEAADIHAELRRILHNPSSQLGPHAPSGFTFELSDVSERAGRRNQLLAELNPVANRKRD